MKTETIEVKTKTQLGEPEIPRPACLIMEAAEGFRVQARSLILRAVRAAGIAGGHYMGAAEAASYNITPRWIGDCTDEQFDKLMTEGRRLADDEGWERFPVDAYHD